MSEHLKTRLAAEALEAREAPAGWSLYLGGQPLYAVVKSALADVARAAAPQVVTTVVVPGVYLVIPTATR